MIFSHRKYHAAKGSRRIRKIDSFFFFSLFVTTPKADLLPVLKLSFTNWKFCSHWNVIQAVSHTQKLKQDCFPKNMALLQRAESWLGVLMLKPSVMTARTPALCTVQRVKNLFYKQKALFVFGETVKQTAGSNPWHKLQVLKSNLHCSNRLLSFRLFLSK